MWGRLRRKQPVAFGSLAMVAGICGVVAFGPLWARANPYQIHPSDRLESPSLQHPFGTDTVGRDLLTRVIYGGRISIAAGTAVIVLAASVGAMLGLFAGYYGGAVDEAISRIADIFLSVPYIILGMAIAAVLGGGVYGGMLGLVFGWWPVYARIVRGEALSLSRRTFVEAARALGGCHSRVLFRHVLPNLLRPLVAQTSLDIGNAILFMSALGFIGVGAAPPSPEWGAMISDAQNYLREAWWYAMFPGLAILMTVMAFNLSAGGLHEMLDPRLR